MLPIRYFNNRTFSGANAASLFMFFGMFGSVFLLAQFFQTVQGLSPLSAGLRILPWTAMPINRGTDSRCSLGIGSTAAR